MIDDKAVRAWIATRMKIDPRKLRFSLEDSFKDLRVYTHHLRGEIRMDKRGMTSSKYPYFELSGVGLASSRYLSFANAYRGEGEVPSVLSPRKREAYREGVEARLREEWKEEIYQNGQDVSGLSS